MPKRPATGAKPTTLRSAINHYLLNPQTKLYATSNLMPNTVAQDANALAVTDGVVDRGQGTSLLKGLQLALPPTPYGPLPFTATTGYMAAVSPFVTNEQVRAEFAQGDTASALSLLQELWGYMDSPGPDFTGADWELVGPDRRAGLRVVHQPGPRMGQWGHGRPLPIRPRSPTVASRLSSVAGPTAPRLAHLG